MLQLKFVTLALSHWPEVSTSRYKLSFNYVCHYNRMQQEKAGISIIAMALAKVLAKEYPLRRGLQFKLGANNK